MCDGTRDAWEPTGASSRNVASPLQHPSGGVIDCEFTIGLGNFWPTKQFSPCGMGPWTAGNTREDEGEAGSCGSRGRKSVDVEGRSGTRTIEGGNFAGDARVAWAAGHVL